MHNRVFRRKIFALIVIPVLLVIFSTSSALAQGVISGSVTNSDATTPANGEINFFSFLDDTDEEIRIESCVNAGYDGVVWSDDFTSYISATAGNPYDHYFYNSTNGEVAVLSGLVPSSSPHTENIMLAVDLSWPLAATGLEADVVSNSSAVIAWNMVTGMTYHVYRRLSSSNGSFFRIDDPSGSLANPGVSDSFYVDNTVDGVSSYHYLIIGEDASGNLSPHSAVLTVNSASINNPSIVSILPSNGLHSGGTSVTISGSGFDLNGATATIGSSNITLITVVSPYEITGLTPAGTPGSAEDVIVTNTASTLSSNTLASGFTYDANDAPVVSDIPDQSISEGGTFTTISLDDYVDDVDNTDAEMTWTYSGNTELTVSIDVNRVATITIPGVDWNGSETITFRATDPGLLFDEDAGIFTVSSDNDAPVVSDIPDQSISEGGTFTTISLDDYVDDVDNTDAEMTWTYSGNTELTVSIDVNRIATITIPGVDWNGSETITFRATDPGLLFDEDAGIFAVSSDNDAPVVSDIPDQSISEGGTFTTISLDDYVDDVDNTDAEMTWTYSGNTELTVSIDVNRIATITIPGVDWNGSETITFRATDPGLLFDEDAGIFAVSSDNDAPVVSDIPDQSISEGGTFTTISLDDYVDDVDNTDAEMTWTYSGNTELTVSIDVNRVATITIPGVDWNGSETITFRATDPGLLFDEDAGIFAVNAIDDAPVLDPIGPQTVAENGTLDLTITASDPDGTIPTLSVTDNPPNSNFTDHGNGTGSFIFNPDFDQVGFYDVIFKAFDGVEVDSEVVTIEVIETNQPPVLDPIGPRPTTEGIPLNFLVTAYDLDGTTPSLLAENLPTTAAFTDHGDGTGTFDWTPDFTEAGLYQVTFRAADAVDTTDEIVDINVAEAGNQPPVLDPIGPRPTTEGVNLNFVVTASDPDGTTPSLLAENLPSIATFTDHGDGTGTFDWTPDFTEVGSYQVTFRAADASDTTDEIVDIEVSEAGNQPPVISSIDDTLIYETDSLVMVVTGSDPDGPGVVLTISTTFSPSLYTFVDSGNGVGVFSYGSDYYSAGFDTVWFFATDMDAMPISVSDTMAVEIVEVNQPPVIDSVGPFGVVAMENLTFTVTANDPTDPDTTNRLFMTASGLPENSTFIDNGNNSGTFNFDPDLSQEGLHSIIVYATDQGTPQYSDQLPIDITVVTENMAPVWESLPTYLIATEGDTLELPVLATDADGDSLVLFMGKAPENSTFEDYGDGTGLYTFMPSYVQAGGGGAGLYQLKLVAYDLIDDTEGLIIIQVDEAGNQRPEIDPITPASVMEGDSQFVVITASDPDGTIPTLTVDSMVTNMIFIDSGNGVGLFEFRPGYAQSGSYDIYVMADDGELVDTIIMTIVVDEAGNQPPVLTEIGPQQTTEKLVLNFDVEAFDPDLDTAILTITDLPEGATFIDNNNNTGTFNWATDNFDSGLYVVTFFATDPFDAALYDSIIVDITIVDTNLAPYPYVPGGQERTVYEGDTLYFLVYGIDPDSTTPQIIVNEPDYSLAENMVWYDSANGTGLLTFIPDYTQGATSPGNFHYLQWLVVDSVDPSLSNPTQPPTQFTILNTNRPPAINEINDTTITEGDTLEFQVIALDPDGQNAYLSVVDLPENATFTGAQEHLKSFWFNPDYTQAGIYVVTFIASDGSADTSRVVTITVDEAGNQNPVFLTSLPGTQPVVAGETHTTLLLSDDPDLDSLIITASFVPINSVFTDSGNGAATFVISPQVSEIGSSYNIRFIVRDTLNATDTVLTTYEVVEFVRGDANSDGRLDMSDIMFLLNFLYKEGPEPASEEATDVNFDELINLLDAQFLIQYFFKQGPPPGK